MISLRQRLRCAYNLPAVHWGFYAGARARAAIPTVRALLPWHGVSWEVPLHAGGVGSILGAGCCEIGLYIICCVRTLAVRGIRAAALTEAAQRQPAAAGGGDRSSRGRPGFMARLSWEHTWVTSTDQHDHCRRLTAPVLQLGRQVVQHEHEFVHLALQAFLDRTELLPLRLHLLRLQRQRQLL